jgi:hypothetical protein
MPITQQQQLALRRGLLYNTATNQLVTFNPVTANTSNVGNLPRTSLVTVTIPIDAEGGDTTVYSVFPPSQPGATVNVIEDGKSVTDVSIWNRVQGVSGSKYIFIRDILSVDSVPAVGDFVESHSDALDNMYASSTQISEINPTITMKIIDIILQAKTTEVLGYAFVAVPSTPLDFKLPGDVSSGCVGPKFVFTISDIVDNTTSLLDSAGFAAFRNKLKQLLGYSDWDNPSTHTQVTFTNLIDDVFGTGNEIKGWGFSSPNAALTSGRKQIKCYTLDGAEWGVPYVIIFEIYKSISECLIFSNGSDVPFNFSPFPLTNPTSQPGLWNTSNPPATFIFNDLLGFGTPESTAELEPNTGNYASPFNETFSDIDCDLFCYKLSKPLISFISSSSTNSKTNVTNVVFGSVPVPTEVVYNGDSINKNSLLDSWEAGYHMAGRILQNKLKK